VPVKYWVEYSEMVWSNLLRIPSCMVGTRLATAAARIGAGCRSALVEDPR
jgi:hypothetical protein